MIHFDDYMTEDSNIPHFLLDQCTDEILLLEHMPLLNPIVNFSEQQINVNSERIFRKHNSLLKFEKQIMQVLKLFSNIKIFSIFLF